MIKGVHAMFYSPAADELRAFFKEKLGLDWFDAGGNWPIYPIAGEVGCHEADGNSAGISFYCDDVAATVESLKARGVVFAGDIEDHGYGLVTFFEAPGGPKIQLYQPRYSKP